MNNKFYSLLILAQFNFALKSRNMFFALLITSVLSSTQAYNTNLSYSVLSECKEYQIDGQYKYRDAFTILDMKNNKPFENEIFRLKLYVFTKQDAHILISNEPKVHKGESAYEIGKNI